MRDVAHIWEAWRSGTHVGDQRPSTRVTVDKAWTLRTTEAVLGQWSRGPARWFEAEDSNLHIETEIPNVVSVQIQRGVDSDAGTCDITITNTITGGLGDIETPAGQFGSPGYFTWDHGSAPDARARWGHALNPWYDVLVPNALIRTYLGYGGHDKVIPDAVADGNIVLYGIWLVDDVNVSTDGTVSLKCRDMAKLLIDQQLFPPLVPLSLYPLKYERYTTKDFTIPQGPIGARGDMCFPCQYTASSTDAAYGAFNAADTGHPAGEAFDISPEPGPDIPGTYAHQRTYWLSEPKAAASDTVWVEFDIAGGQAGDINEIYYHAWAGNYRVMVSVVENGTWVPPETRLGGMTPEGVPYVSTFAVDWEGGPVPGQNTNLYALPRMFRATRIRLTITNLVPADGGYRAGARKLMACFANSNPSVPFPTLVFAGASIPVNEDNRQGYWQARATGEVFAFGDARVYPATSPATIPQSTVIGMAVHPSGNGYWLVDVTGRVLSYGQSHHHGDLADAGITDVADLAPTPSGNGYWLLRRDGHIHSFGDAIDQGVSTHTGTLPSGAPAVAQAIDSHPSTQGYWILWTDGHVSAHNVTDHGSPDRTGMADLEYFTTLRRTSTGAGYWILTGLGIVKPQGDATHQGNAVGIAGVTYDKGNWFKGLCWDLLPSTVDDTGYAIQKADGNLEPKGEAGSLLYGSVGSGHYTLRFDGNYKDYSDIIRDLLLWAGFYLYKNPQPVAEMPDVYGNIETTGAWAEDFLPREMFDKKPVIDAIKELRDIVGYLFFIDAEGGARFESPNWWALGNYLIDGTPYNHIPEVDEKVNLLSHNIVFSAASARSELIIATEDPQPQEAGQDPNKGITQTRITPKTAPDLRGLIVPAMWTNGKFLRPDEQRIMAELLDMRMWLARRTAQVNCTANPLIDINDQVRVVERQTGEVFVHYITGISIRHDLESGDFTMDLSTHWMGGAAYGKPVYYLSAAAHPAGSGYWQATLNGQVYPFGAAQAYDRHQADSHTGWVVAIRSTPSGSGYYTVDFHGKVLTYGDAVHQGDVASAPTEVVDLALTPSGAGYWILEKSGVVHSFGDAVFYGQTTNGGRKLPVGIPVVASSIESHPVTQGYWVLWTDGTVDAFNLTHHGNADRATGFNPIEITTVLRRTHDGGGYYIPSGGGDRLQTFGNATNLGATTQYPDEQWSFGLVWDMIIDPDGTGYALQRADGSLITYGDFEQHTPAVEPVTAFWSLVSEGDETDASTFPVSARVMKFLQKTGSPSANNAVASGFSAPSETAMTGST